MKFCSFDLRCIHDNGLQKLLTFFIVLLNVTVPLFPSSNNTLNQVWAAKIVKQQIYGQHFETIALFVIKICYFFYFHFSAYMIT